MEYRFESGNGDMKTLYLVGVFLVGYFFTSYYPLVGIGSVGLLAFKQFCIFIYLVVTVMYWYVWTCYALSVLLQYPSVFLFVKNYKTKILEWAVLGFFCFILVPTLLYFNAVLLMLQLSTAAYLDNSAVFEGTHIRSGADLCMELLQSSSNRELLEDNNFMAAHPNSGPSEPAPPDMGDNIFGAGVDQKSQRPYICAQVSKLIKVGVPEGSGRQAGATIAQKVLQIPDVWCRWFDKRDQS